MQMKGSCMVSRKTFVAVIVVAALCSACGSLIPVAKVSAPPSVSDNAMKKADADCKNTGAAGSSSSTAAGCKGQTPTKP